MNLKLFEPNTLEYWRYGEYVVYDFPYYGGTTSGQGIYLSRNKDSYMESSNYINPDELIYLFKLK